MKSEDGQLDLNTAFLDMPDAPQNSMAGRTFIIQPNSRPRRLLWLLSGLYSLEPSQVIENDMMASPSLQDSLKQRQYATCGLPFVQSPS